MYQTRSAARVSPQIRLRAVIMAGAALYEAAERGDPMGPREAAQAVEINQQYIDILEEMEHMPLEISSGQFVEVNERRLRFPDIDAVANWITGVWHDSK